LKKTAVQYALVCVAIIAGLAYYYWPWLSGQQAFYQTDITNYFEPLCKFVAERYRAGQIPLWNPYLYCGMPQCAVLSPSMFYPGTLLFVPFSFSQALAIYLIVHQLLATLGMFLLVRSLRWGTLPALIAALGFGLCGYMYSGYQNFTLMATATWFPWLLYFTRQISIDRTLRNVLYAFGLSVSVFLTIAAGRPEVWLGTMAVTFAFMVASAVRTKEWRRLAYRVVAFGLGIALAGPVLLPALEWTRLSPRQHGMNLAFAMTWNANWYDWISTTFIPPMGNLFTIGNPYYNVVGSRFGALPYVGSGYVGPLIMTFAVFALFGGKWRWKWWLLALLVGSMIMTAGADTPIAPWLADNVPFLNFFRYPVKLLVVPCFIACLLAAKGASLMFDRKIGLPILISLGLVWLAFVIAGNWLQNYNEMIPQLVTRFEKSTYSPSVVFAAQRMFGDSFAGTATFGIVCVFLSWMQQAKMAPSKIISACIVCLLALTLGFGMASYQPAGRDPQLLSGMPKLATDIKSCLSHAIPGLKYSSRCAYLYPDPLFFALDSNEGDPDGKLYYYMRQLLVANLSVAWNVPSAQGYEAANKGAYDRILSQCVTSSSFSTAPELRSVKSDAPLSRFYANAAVDTVICQTEFKYKEFSSFEKGYFSLFRQDPQLNFTILKHEAHPRAYFANQVVWVDDAWHEFAGRLPDPRDPEKISANTFVEMDAGQDRLLNVATPTPDCKILGKSDEDNLVALSVELPEAKPNQKYFLVLCDSFYPGWEATVDGQAVDVFKTNGFFRGIIVPPGHHEIVFSFRPLSVLVGSILCMVALIAYAAILLITRRKPT
jgi:hypothetical protein